MSGSLAVNADFFFSLADDYVEYLTGTCRDL